MTQLELDLQAVVDDMTIEQRIDTALHPVTAKAQYLELVENNQAFIFLDDCDHFSVCVTLDIINSDNDALLSAVTFDDVPVKPTAKQLERLEWLATDIYRCSLDNGGHENYYDQSLYGFTNSDWLSA